MPCLTTPLDFPASETDYYQTEKNSMSGKIMEICEISAAVQTCMGGVGELVWRRVSVSVRNQKDSDKESSRLSFVSTPTRLVDGILMHETQPAFHDSAQKPIGLAVETFLK